MQLNFDDFNKTNVVPLSTIDWTGKAAMVVFLKGCNFKCCFCQNLRIAQSFAPAPTGQLIKEIKRNKQFVNALIFSGGEPTLHPTVLITLATEAKRQGLLVGIETNGSCPKVLERLISSRLLDGLFIDLKAPLNDKKKYSDITGIAITDVHIKRIRESIDAGRAAYMQRTLSELELRTTLFKNMLSGIEINELVNQFPDVSYALQQGRIEQCSHASMIPMARGELVDLATQCGRSLKVRTRERGEEDIS